MAKIHYSCFVESFEDFGGIPYLAGPEIAGDFPLFCRITKKDRQNPKLTVTTEIARVKREPFLSKQTRVSLAISLRFLRLGASFSSPLQRRLAARGISPHTKASVGANTTQRSLAAPVLHDVVRNGYGQKRGPVQQGDHHD